MEVQLEMDFSQDEIAIVEATSKTQVEVEPHKPLKCKHSIRIKSFKKDYLSYCSKCGKILSVKHKKGE